MGFNANFLKTARKSFSIKERKGHDTVRMAGMGRYHSWNQYIHSGQFFDAGAERNPKAKTICRNSCASTQTVNWFGAALGNTK